MKKFTISEIEKKYDFDGLDGWKNPMRLNVFMKDGAVQYEILSAGEDGQMKTEDDLSSLDIEQWVFRLYAHNEDRRQDDSEVG